MDNMFQNIFNRKEDNTSGIDRILLTSDDQLDELLKASHFKPVLLFKHSTSCSISAMVIKWFENKLESKKGEYHYFFLDLIRYRNISNLIVRKFDISHQSPQLILIENGKVVGSAS
ncbi:MAG: bacillithiol system redox-active protein YtxJ, partial [Flavobacteriaceae bacterium]|nr:bacillithiol system redox-active protein YtxJ [Flavobacteriaceae bacterium]